MNKINPVNRTVVDTALLDAWVHHKEEGRCLMVRPLVMLVLERSTNKIVAIYCAIGQAAEHKLYELLELRENMLDQKEDIIQRIEFEEVSTTKIENEGVYKLCESMAKGKVEKFWQKINDNLKEVLEEGQSISMNAFLESIIQAKKELDKRERHRADGK